jgi:hypothetical protein
MQEATPGELPAVVHGDNDVDRHRHLRSRVVWRSYVRTSGPLRGSSMSRRLPCVARLGDLHCTTRTVISTAATGTRSSRRHVSGPSYRCPRDAAGRPRSSCAHWPRRTVARGTPTLGSATPLSWAPCWLRVAGSRITAPEAAAESGRPRGRPGARRRAEAQPRAPKCRSETSNRPLDGDAARPAREGRQDVRGLRRPAAT